MNNHEIREAWRKAGGSFHGPIVETSTMPEEAMFDFVRGLIAAEREACAKVCETGFGGDAALVARACAVKIRTRSNAKLSRGELQNAKTTQLNDLGSNAELGATEYLDCDWTPDTPDACPFCAGTLCNKCGAGGCGFTGHCEHDSLERHEIVRRLVPNA